LDTEPWEQPAPDQGANDPDGDISDQSKPPAGHKLASQPARDETNQQYDEQTFP